MNLPETFAGGTFDLPLTVARLVRLAEQTEPAERDVARRKLWTRGYFLDRSNTLWTLDEFVPEVSKDDFFEEMAS